MAKVNEQEIVRLTLKTATALSSFQYLKGSEELVEEKRIRKAWNVVCNYRSALKLALCSLEGELSADVEFSLRDLGVIA